MKWLALLLFLILVNNGFTQTPGYTGNNLHAHNDYEKPIPFYDAFSKGFGSIEADIFLVEGKLLVAHSADALIASKNLEGMYLQPLDSILHKHAFPFADTTRCLQLLVDIKSDAVTTLDALTTLLKNHPAIISNKHILITISGNRPPVNSFENYPAFIHFDGLIKIDYDGVSTARVPLISENFKSFSKWDGAGVLPAADAEKLKLIIQQAHGQHRKIRFWNAPDNANAWKTLMELNVDYLNTDQYALIVQFINKN